MHKLRTLHLFAGCGGGLLADFLLGHHPVCAVEIDTYCQQVLHQRQQDGILPWFPIFADVRQFDGKPWNGLVDVVCGGFPCTDISIAGKGAGIDGEQSGLWKEMRRVVGEVRPVRVFVENSPMLTSRGLGNILGDLASLGYDAQWGVLGVHHCGGPHKRNRMWVDANANGVRRSEMSQRFDCAPHPTQHGDNFPKKGLDSNTISNGLQRISFIETFIGKDETKQKGSQTSRVVDSGPWAECRNENAPRILGVANGVAHRVDRLKAIGNGQVPYVAWLAWQILSQ